MKYVLIIVMIALITYVGHGLSKYYLDRQIFFSKMRQFLQVTQSKITFSQTKLISVVRHALLIEDNKYMLSFLSQYEETLKDNLPLNVRISILKRDEMQWLNEVLRRMGKADLTTENNNINNALDDVARFCHNADEESKKYGGFYTKIALLLALTMALLFV